MARSTTVFADQVYAAEVCAEELQLAQTLVAAASVTELDYGRYRDAYTAKLTQLIEAKVAGQQIVAPPAPQTPDVINLLDALRQNVARTQAITNPSVVPASIAPQEKAPKARRAVRRTKPPIASAGVSV